MIIKAKKHLGQHFLVDENIARKITTYLTERGYKYLLEIGPGMGILTKYLLQKKLKLTVIEIDAESVNYLRSTFWSEFVEASFSEDGFRILEGDFLKFDIVSFFNRSEFAIIGNFPYNISTQIVFKAIENRAYVIEFIGMFQKEVAERIAEKPGSKAYGIISVLTQAFYKVEYLFTIPPTVFKPSPKVYSGLIRLTRKENYTLPANEKMFFRIVKTAFNQRRKMLRKSLKSFNFSDSTKAEVIFAKRPEQLSVEDFILLTQKIKANGI